MKSNKQRRFEIVQKRANKRDQRQLQKKLANTNAVYKPSGALSVDASKFLKFGVYSFPLIALDGFYQNYEFNCKDCGVHQVWTAHYQKIYYEIWNGGIEQCAVRCRPCRIKQKTQRLETERLRQLG